MSEPSGRGRAPGSRERDEYMDRLASEAVPVRQSPFHVTRVNQFIRAMDGRDPDTLDERESGDIPASFGRREDLRDWQFAQPVDAVRMYPAGTLKPSAAHRVDWTYRRGSARTLKADHASTARECGGDHVRPRARRTTNAAATPPAASATP